MKFSTMFSPVQIGSVTVPNRFVVPPMGNNLANTDGSLSERSLSHLCVDFHRRTVPSGRFS